MAKFGVNIVKVRALEPIPGADKIELAVVGDYRSVVKKGDFTVGALGVYIPEAALVPQWLLREINLEGKLAGPDKNRVKAIKLRGCLSQGILLPTCKYAYTDEDCINVLVHDDAGESIGAMQETVKEGDDVAEILGITKWEPTIPAYMSGEIYNVGQHLTVPYDIENFKKFPDVLTDGEEVIFTEKLHGTFCGVGIVPPEYEDPKHYKGKFVVFSKGYGAKGQAFQESDKNEGNVYFRALHKAGVFQKLEDLRADMIEDNGEFPRPMFILGEVFGGSIQDANWYSNDIDFRLFDVCTGFRGDQHYFGFVAREFLANHLGVKMVPVLYRGPFSKAVMEQYTSGKETVSGEGRNMREGIVVTPVEERRNDDLGRVILKSVSEEYLLRNGGTEFN